MTGRYPEADIAQLEREDLTDRTVIAKLREAYRQNDPDEEEIFPGFRRSARDFTIGTEEDFERWIAEAEAELQSNPTDYMTRMKRLEAPFAPFAVTDREMHVELEAVGLSTATELRTLWTVKHSEVPARLGVAARSDDEAQAPACRRWHGREPTTEFDERLRAALSATDSGQPAA